MSQEGVFGSLLFFGFSFLQLLILPRRAFRRNKDAT